MDEKLHQESGQIPEGHGSTDTSFNTAHLLEKEVKQDIVREYKSLLGYIAKQEAKHTARQW